MRQSFGVAVFLKRPIIAGHVLGIDAFGHRVSTQCGNMMGRQSGKRADIHGRDTDMVRNLTPGITPTAIY